jgi:hypothetical protein
LHEVSKYDFIRCLAIEKYLNLLKDWNEEMSSSRTVATDHFPKQNVEHQFKKNQEVGRMGFKTQATTFK